ALDWMAGWWKKLGGRPALAAFNKLFTQKNDQNGFTQGKQGLAIIGEYSPVVYKKEFPNFNFATGFLPVQTAATYGTGIADGGNVFVIPKNAPHPQESVVFIKSLGGPAAVLEWNVKENNLPPVQSVALSADFAKQVPLMHTWLDMLKLSSTENHLVGPIAHPAVQQFGTIKGPILNDILDGKTGAREGLQQLDQLLKPVLAKYQ
ncbi:MAG: extracellular solute-binding protein, partial [Chloroflexota bacterium]